MGSLLASFTVEAFGTERLQTVQEEELQARLKAFSNMIRVGGL